MLAGFLLLVCLAGLLGPFQNELPLGSIVETCNFGFAVHFIGVVVCIQSKRWASLLSKVYLLGMVFMASMFIYYSYILFDENLDPSVELTKQSGIMVFSLALLIGIAGLGAAVSGSLEWKQVLSTREPARKRKSRGSTKSV